MHCSGNKICAWGGIRAGTGTIQAQVQVQVQTFTNAVSLQRRDLPSDLRLPVDSEIDLQKQPAASTGRMGLGVYNELHKCHQLLFL